MTLKAEVWLFDGHLEFMAWLIDKLVTGFAVLLGGWSVNELAEHHCRMACTADARTLNLFRRLTGRNAGKKVDLWHGNGLRNRYIQ